MSRRCFFVAPIGKEGSPERKHSDSLLRFVVKPVCEDLGYTVERADENAQPGDINVQTIESVLHSELVVADLSFLNPNVFYELGMRHAARLPVIHMYREVEGLPFDVAGYRAITFSGEAWDATLHESLKTQLTKQMEHVEDGEYSGPVSSALAISELRASDKPLDAVLTSVLDRLGSIETRISQPTSERSTIAPREMHGYDGSTLRFSVEESLRKGPALGNFLSAVSRAYSCEIFPIIGDEEQPGSAYEVRSAVHIGFSRISAQANNWGLKFIKDGNVAGGHMLTESP